MAQGFSIGKSAANTMSVEGLKELQRQLTETLPDQTGNALENAMRRAEGAVHRHAAGIVPVDTGRLKNSIFWDDPYWGGNTIFGEVGTNVEYAPDVEADQPYLLPALRNEERTINDIFAMELKAAQHV